MWNTTGSKGIGLTEFEEIKVTAAQQKDKDIAYFRVPTQLSIFKISQNRIYQSTKIGEILRPP